MISLLSVTNRPSYCRRGLDIRAVVARKLRDPPCSLLANRTVREAGIDSLARRRQARVAILSEIEADLCGRRRYKRVQRP